MVNSTLFLMRFFRNLEQHFHDQTDEGVLALKPYDQIDTDQKTDVNEDDASWLESIRARPTKQREVISNYIKQCFPTFILSLWRILQNA